MQVRPALLLEVGPALLLDQQNIEAKLICTAGIWRSPRTNIVFDGEWQDGCGQGLYTRPRDGVQVPGTWKPHGVPAAEEVAARRAASIPAESRAATLLERTAHSRSRQRASVVPWAERGLLQSRDRS